MHNSPLKKNSINTVKQKYEEKMTIVQWKKHLVSNFVVQTSKTYVYLYNSITQIVIYFLLMLSRKSDKIMKNNEIHISGRTGCDCTR